MRTFLIITAICFASVFLSSCSKTDRATQAAKDKVLLLGNGAEPKTLDPQLVQSVGDSNIMNALFEGLVSYHPSDDTIDDPGVAESWEPNEDYTLWTFHLRKDAKWSNGDPVTANDFIYAYSRILHHDFASPYVSMLYYIKNAEGVNQKHLGRFLCGPESNFELDWETVKKVDFRPGEETKPAYNVKGLDFLSKEELEILQDDLSLFEWPEGFVESAKEDIVTRFLAFYESGKEVWDIADIGVKAPDDYTLEIRLKQPTFYFPQIVKHTTWYPVHQGTIEKFGGKTEIFTQWQRPPNLVGNGSFKLKGWRVNHSVIVVPNEHYWDRDLVKLKEIWFLPVDNAYTEERMFRDGLIHYAYTVPPNLIKIHQERNPEQITINPYAGSYFYRFNTDKPPLDNPKVRRALTLAVDRAQIVKYITLGGQEPAYGFTPPTEGGYGPPKAVEFNPELAQKLLAEAGYPEGEGMPDFELLINTSEAHRSIAVAIQDMWKRHLKIDVKIDNQEWKVFQQTVTNQEYEIARAGWIADYIDPTTFLDMWRTGDSNNNTGWSNADYDRLLEEAALAPDPEARGNKLLEAETIMLDELPVLPIYWYTGVRLIHPAVTNWHPVLLDKRDYKHIDLVVPES